MESVTKAPTEQAPTMTLREAETVIAEWQANLQQAQMALVTHEQQIGEIALAQGVENATQGLTRLQVEVKMAETGLAAAQVQRGLALHVDRVQRAKNMRVEIAALTEEANRQAAILNELGPKVAAARNRMEESSRRASVLELNVYELERKIKEAETNG